MSVFDWRTDGASLTCNDKSFEVFSSHYSLGCSVQGELVAVNTVAQLEQPEIKDKIVLLYGEIASQQIAPKNFPFWNPEEHQQLISLLENSCPKALVCATERNSATAGGVYPFPLFEDGDFDIPSVYMKDAEGEKLLAFIGQKVELESKAVRIPETAFNVIGRNSNESKGRIAVTAHIDTKIGTPGAIDIGTTVDRPDGSYGFSCIPYAKDFDTFLAGGLGEIKRVRESTELVSGHEGLDIVYCTVLRGLRFTSMSQIYTAGSSIPLLAYGESFMENGRKKLPHSVHVNHAFVDGSHMRRYFEFVQNYLDSPR